MKIAIIDADLIGRKRHRFPNLACMKISAHHKAAGDTVELKTDYSGLADYDAVYLSKVFTDTPVPDEVLELKNVSYGGTGFYYDKAPCLSAAIEHQMPDYHLYNEWVSVHSPLTEFYDPARPKICLLDDNFFGCPKWRELLSELKQQNKPFQFKQGLDERLLTVEKCAALFSSKYDGDYIFAFDNVADAKLIEEKIQLARNYTDAVMKFYCFCGFDRNDRWDDDFWQQDIFDLLFRIEILMRNRCLPYVMRFARYTESPYRGMYVTLARWCNQPSFFKKKSLREFAIANGTGSACYRYLADFEQRFPEVTPYLDMKFK